MSINNIFDIANSITHDYYYYYLIAIPLLVVCLFHVTTSKYHIFGLLLTHHFEGFHV